MSNLNKMIQLNKYFSRFYFFLVANWPKSYVCVVWYAMYVCALNQTIKYVVDVGIVVVAVIMNA